PATAQVRPAGCASTVTLHDVPKTTPCVKEKVVAPAATVICSLGLPSVRPVKLPRPVMVPLIWNGRPEQLTVPTFSAVSTAVAGSTPVAPGKVQDSPTGIPATATEYCAPTGTGSGKV